MTLSPRGRTAIVGAALILAMVSAVAFIALRFTSDAEARLPISTASVVPASTPTNKRLGKAEARRVIKAAVGLVPGAKAVRDDKSAPPRVLSPANCAKELNNTKESPDKVAESTYKIPQPSEPDLKITFTIEVRSGKTDDDVSKQATDMGEAIKLCSEFVVGSDGRRDVHRLSSYSADYPAGVRPLLELRVKAGSDDLVGAISHVAAAGHRANSISVGWTYAYHGSEPAEQTKKLDEMAAKMLLAGLAVLP